MDKLITFGDPFRKGNILGAHTLMLLKQVYKNESCLVKKFTKFTKLVTFYYLCGN